MSNQRNQSTFFRTLFFAFVALTLLYSGISKLILVPSEPPFTTTALAIDMSVEALSAIVSLIEIAIALTISYAIIPRPEPTKRSRTAGILSMAMLFVYSSGVLLAHAIYSNDWTTLRFGLGLIYWIGSVGTLGMMTLGIGGPNTSSERLRYAEE